MGAHCLDNQGNQGIPYRRAWNQGNYVCLLLCFEFVGVVNSFTPELAAIRKANQVLPRSVMPLRGTILRAPN